MASRQPAPMNLVTSIDLNCDLGEHDGGGYADDSAILDIVTSANIACGAHAGSKEVMRSTIRAAMSRDVCIGAHPGYDDRSGFGRRETNAPLSAVRESLASQLESMAECCAAEGAALRYVKPHGALYNRAAVDPQMAELIVTTVSAFDASLWLLALAGSAMERAALQHDVNVAREAFIDRAYMADGTLVPRTMDGATLTDPDVAAARAVRFAREARVLTIDNEDIEVHAESLCVHGDGATARQTVDRARAELRRAGIALRTFVR
ncbi:MAG: 5-oxoprolinase subunit PxpA [Gemmatimonadaceae bacterium]